MATLNTTIPTASLNYAGAGSGHSLTRHVPSYTDQRIVWFKGVDNLLDLTVTGSDRRPVSLLNKELTMTFWDTITGTTIFRRRAVGIVPENGQARLTVFARDLMTLPRGIYQLAATFVDGNGLETALTWNRAMQAGFDVEVKDEVVPTNRTSIIVDTWTNSDGTLVSSAINGPSYYRKDTTLFSIALYASNYTGTVKLQGTLDEVVTAFTLWADLTAQEAISSTLTLTGYTGIDPYNYYAGVRWLRTVRVDNANNAGTLDKILIRV